jgi:hypothetical protein
VASGVRFTKPEREWLRVWLKEYEDGPTPTVGRLKLCESIVDKLDKSELVRARKKQRGGLSIDAALAAFAVALGGRLIRPPPRAFTVFGQMARRIADLGLTKEDCTRIAIEAGRRWPRGGIKAESIVRQADRLMTREVTVDPEARAPDGPMGMEDI